MQETSIAQQCTNNTTLASQQTNQRSSIYNLLRKFAKREMMVPSPPHLLCKGA